LHSQKHGNRTCTVDNRGTANGPAWSMDLEEDLLERRGRPTKTNTRAPRSKTTKKDLGSFKKNELVKVKVKGTVRLLDKVSGSLYDLEEYERTGELVEVARLRKP